MYSTEAEFLRRCTGLKRDGSLCRAWAAWDDPSQLCVAHSGRHHTGPILPGPRPALRRANYRPCQCSAYEFPHRCVVDTKQVLVEEPDDLVLHIHWMSDVALCVRDPTRPITPPEGSILVEGIRSCMKHTLQPRDRPISNESALHVTEHTC